MRKVVINDKYGGFSLSEKAKELYLALSSGDLHASAYFVTGENEKRWLDCRSIARDDPLLVQVVEQLGREAGSRHAKLEIVEIPRDVDFVIQEYDGAEHVAEKHRTWYANK